jgi:hypothetical protein
MVMAGLVPAISIMVARAQNIQCHTQLIEIAGTSPAMTPELRQSHRNML